MSRALFADVAAGLRTSPGHREGARRIERPAIRAVVAQHVEEAAHLRHVRSVLVRAGHVRLLQLERLDERIAAHLEGIALAGDCGRTLTLQALERPGIGAMHTAAVGALLDRDARRLDDLLDIAEALPACRAGVLSAFGWVAAAELADVARPLFRAASAWRREVALAGCAMHLVDPRSALVTALGDTAAGVRAGALRLAGRCGRRDLVGACLEAIDTVDERQALEGARSALLLGDRRASVDALERFALAPASDPRVALAASEAVLKVMPPERARRLVAAAACDSTRLRGRLHGIAIAGDPLDVPWLVSSMDDPTLARLAGEAFSAITGLDLVRLDLDRDPPGTVRSGPNDDPDDADVAMDEDDGLPWPDPAKIATWWKSNGARFVPGGRCFMGETPTPAKCLDVLRNGAQRQRIAAAEHLTLLAPGTPLFNVAAPAWRQRRLLAETDG